MIWSVFPHWALTPFSFYVLCWPCFTGSLFLASATFLHLGYHWCVFWLVTPFWSGSTVLMLELYTKMLSGYWVAFILWCIYYVLTRILFLDTIYDIYIFPITYVLNNKYFYQMFWVVCYDAWGLCEMSQAPIDGSPRTPVTIPEMGCDKLGVQFSYWACKN